MAARFTIGLVALILFGVFGLATIWEFLLEDIVFGVFDEAYQMESVERRWEFVATSTVVAGVALIMPTILLRREAIRRIRYESALRASEETKSSVFSASQDSIFLLDGDGVILEANDAGSARMGMSVREIIGKSVFDFMPPDVAVRRREWFAELQQTSEGGTYEDERQGHWFETRVDPLFNEDGSIHSVAVVARDITERRQVEKLRNEFISTVSHELRTPLTSIHGSLSLLSQDAAGEVSGDAQRLVQIAKSNSDRLVTLVNDILDTQKIESGGMEFRPRVTDAYVIVNEALTENAAYGEKYGVGLKLIEGSSGMWINADVDRVKQILANLLSNAAKFSARGSAVDVSVLRQDGMIRTVVKDYGPGIPEEFHDRVFEKFAQADSSDTRRVSGTGLGLSIAKTMVERMNGEIGFESVEGEGCAFYLDVPEHPRADIVVTS